MKISKLFEEYEKNQYLIGGIFSNPIFTSNNKILYVSTSKKQITNKELKLDESYKIFADKIKELNPSYDVYNLDGYNYKKMTNYRLNKSNAAVIVEFENDLFPELNEEKVVDHIYLNCLSSDRTEFIRGVFDCSGSVDVSTMFITRDLLKKNGRLFPYYIADILNNFFAMIPLNFNKRYSQPSNISMQKNTQFRLNLAQFFSIVGTYRDYTIRMLNANYNKKLDNIGTAFDIALYIPLTNVLPTPEFVSEVKLVFGG